MVAKTDTLRHCERILAQFPELFEQASGSEVRAIMEAVLSDSAIQANFAGAKIRYISTCGDVAREILVKLGKDPNQLGLMAIGDIYETGSLKEVIDEILIEIPAYHAEIREEMNGLGYDLSSKGSPIARAMMFEYFEPHFGFSKVPVLKKKLLENSTITGGGMEALSSYAIAIMRESERNGLIQRFIYPDNSFATWPAVIDALPQGDNVRCHTIATEQKDLLHLTPEKVRTFYTENEAENTNDVWYITPVANPSGTMIRPDVLFETCEEIIRKNPRAIIVLDCVYVRTLKPRIARELMDKVIRSAGIMERVIFIESFSKTHGLCGERLGTFFTANPKLYQDVQNVDMKIAAGHGHMKSAFVMAIADTNDERETKLEKLHEFWRLERVGLYKHLIESAQFRHLFHADQSHILPEQLSKTPMGLYLFLRLNEGVTFRDVVMDTGCFGLESNFESGNYIRFSVGRMVEPTYSKYVR